MTRPSLAKGLTQSIEHAARPQAVKSAESVAAPMITGQVGYHAATRIGKKKVTAPLDPEAHKLLKRLAVDKGTTVEQLLLEAIRDLFSKYDKMSAA